VFSHLRFVLFEHRLRQKNLLNNAQTTIWKDQEKKRITENLKVITRVNCSDMSEMSRLTNLEEILLF